MALALLANTAPRILQILNAAPPGTFSATVATSPVVGAFPTDAEILAAELEADEMVATQGYFQSVNDSLANPFNVTSSPGVSGDSVPQHHGDLSKVELSTAVLLIPPASINTTTDVITYSNHGLHTGDVVTWILGTGGVIPTSDSPTLAVATNYYAIVLTSSTFKLARSYANAFAPVAVDITSQGTAPLFLIPWKVGIKTNVDAVLNAIAVGDTYVGAGAFDSLYAPADGNMYTTADFWRVVYPDYVRTSVLQCNKNEETLIIATAVRILTKNASPAPFASWAAESSRGLQQLTQDGSYTSQVQMEAND